MENEIPNIVDELYRYFVTQPDPKLWPDHLQSSPIQGHGLWSFYQGLRLGMQLTDACLEKI